MFADLHEKHEVLNFNFIKHCIKKPESDFFIVEVLENVLDVDIADVIHGLFKSSVPLQVLNPSLKEKFLLTLGKNIIS